MSHLGDGPDAALTLERLDAATAAAVHEASMRIVEEVGVRLEHARARSVFEAHGASVDADGVVTAPRGLIEECVEAAPAEFTLHARDPEKSVVVGGEGPPVRAPGYGPPNVRTFGGGRRRARLTDYEDLLRLAQLEDAITCTGYTLCEPHDVEESVKHYELLRRSLTLTDQPVMGSAYGPDRAQASLEMVGIAVEDPDLSRPYVAGLVNTVPPRSLDEASLGGLLTYAEAGQPLVVSSFTMAGASGPSTLSASMAQANAENLVAIALAQLVAPGTPVVYGVPSSNVDPRYGSLSTGGPESALFAAFAAQMGRYYGIPSRGGGGLSDAKTVDYQGGFESMLVQAVTAFSGVDYVLNAAGVLESYATVSPEKFVLDCEMLRSLDRVQRGVDLEGTDVVGEVAAVEPAGHYLTERDEAPTEGRFYRSAVADKRSHDDWAAAGAKSAFELGRERVDALLERYERPPMDEAVERELTAYVEAATSDAG